MAEKILVTGGNGYIGSHIIEYYTRKGFTVHNLDLAERSTLPVAKYYSFDVTNIDDVIRIDNSYNVIFHCAGSASVPHSVENPLKDFEVNVQGALNMLDFVRNSGSGMFVFLSSVSVFDTINKLPLSEFSFKKSSSPYGAGKLAAESYCQSYYKTYGVDTRIARIFNTYGPGMNHLFIADMMKKISNAKDEIVIGGSGNQIRDYVFISDLVKALAIIADKGQPGEDYNICSGEKTSLLKISKILLEKMGRDDLRIICDGITYSGDIEKWYGNPEKLLGLGFNFSVGLGEGLGKTIKFQKLD